MEMTMVLTASGLLTLIASAACLLYTWFTTDLLEEDY